MCNADVLIDFETGRGGFEATVLFKLELELEEYDRKCGNERGDDGWWCCVQPAIEMNLSRYV